MRAKHVTLAASYQGFGSLPRKPSAWPPPFPSGTSQGPRKHVDVLGRGMFGGLTDVGTMTTFKMSHSRGWTPDEQSA